MARLQVRTDANALLAEVEIPDTALPRLRTVFGGTTAAQTAAAFLAWVVPTLRTYVRRTILEGKWAADFTAVNTGQATEETALDTDWP